VIQTVLFAHVPNPGY